MISDLLSRWEKFEPERCKLDRSVEAYELCNSNGDFQMLYPHGRNPPRFAWLMACVLDAIDAHHALYKLENDTAGRAYASIRGRDVFKTADDNERAIALLSAYVAWLEAVAADKTT